MREETPPTPARVCGATTAAADDEADFMAAGRDADLAVYESTAHEELLELEPGDGDPKAAMFTESHTD